LSEKLSRNVDHANRTTAGTLLEGAVSKGIRFCSWKSNSHLDAGLRGDTDVDILVAPSEYDDLEQYLLAGGCIEVAPPPDGRHEGMTHFLGMDERGGLFHLHVHDRLVLGQRYAKNYTLPLTDALLASTTVRSGIPQPDPAVELVVLACRSILKYRVRDMVKDVLRIRTPGIPADTAEEVEWCSRQIDDESLEVGLTSCSNVVPPELVRSFLEILSSRPRSGLRLWALRTRLERALAPHRRRSRLAAASTYFWYLTSSRIRPRWNPKLRTKGRGKSIAVIGADGAGKTTISVELASWLSERLAVSRYYMGSKEPSRATSASYIVFRMLRRGHRDTTSFLRETSLARRAIAYCRDAMLAVHHLSVARDRLRRMRRVRDDLGDSQVVVLDRYPLEVLGSSPELRLLDGPSIKDHRDGLLGLLADRETRMYRNFDLPNAIVLLRVDPHVAIARKPDHDLSAVTQKTLGVDQLEEILTSRGEGSRLTVIDANEPWPLPLDRAREAVWQVLSTGVGRST
jgi:thymidylate kinase